MRILILTQYFPPETGAPQNRLMGLATRLEKKGTEVVVITAMPNYPQMKVHKQYRKKWHVSEKFQDINVERAWIYASSDRSMFKRLLNYFSFVFSSWLISFRVKGTFDFLICESPPLFLGISGWLISRRKKAKFIFNVSDLWPESAEKLGLVKNKFILRMATKLEEFLYKKSVLITGQTQGIVKTISYRFPEKKVHWLPNGIDPENLPPTVHSNWRKENGFSESDFILLYAGIIGYAQGLDVILECAEKLMSHESVKFVLLGDGPEKERLMMIKEEKKLTNVFFKDVVSKSKVFEILAGIDASIIPLKKLDLFKGAIPSKIFESLAMKKPILLGVEGEANELFIKEGKCGLAFEPEDADALAANVLRLLNDRRLLKEMGENGHVYVFNNFTREKITDDFYRVLKDG